MSSSIEFVRAVPSALTELKAACQRAGAVISKEEDVNDSAGVKLHGTFGDEALCIILYYNRRKGTSSRIVFEKAPEGVQTLVAADLTSQQKIGPRYQSASSRVGAQSALAAREAPRLKQNGYIGTDESGKGDYFGPLVVAGVYLDSAGETHLRDTGVQDSKKLSDKRIMDLAKKIRSSLDKTHYSVVAIGPERYNDLYVKIGNLNKLLAWGHARSIENILAAVDCGSAISDQFGDESYIRKALFERGKGIELLQMPRAEEHTAVAAASVLAREAFLLRLARLSKEFGVELPKGASSQVEDAARQLIEKHGMNALRQCAKVHFRTTQKLGMQHPAGC
jgi:ribonuclease HIII